MRRRHPPYGQRRASKRPSEQWLQTGRKKAEADGKTQPGKPINARCEDEARNQRDKGNPHSGRQARQVRRKARGGFIYRLFMKWFGAAGFRA
jgi:hypothetical protein